MMFSNVLATVGTCLLSLAAAAPSAPAFSGNFLISNMVVDSPFQANATATNSSSIEFDFGDEDTPNSPGTHCTIHWAVGLTPTSAKFSCTNAGFRAVIPDGMWLAVANFMLNLTHTYIDNSIGESPYNVLSKYGHVHLAYPNTTNYECDLARAHCESCNGTTIVAVVTQAWA